jgi:hypothetical protein
MERLKVVKLRGVRNVIQTPVRFGAAFTAPLGTAAYFPGIPIVKALSAFLGYLVGTSAGFSRIFLSLVFVAGVGWVLAGLSLGWQRAERRSVRPGSAGGPPSPFFAFAVLVFVPSRYSCLRLRPALFCVDAPL